MPAWHGARRSRTTPEGLLALRVGQATHSESPLVRLRELVTVNQTKANHSSYRKKFMPVTYVLGDVARVVESPVYAILKMNKAVRSLGARQFGGISDTTGGCPQGLSRLAAVL